MNKEIRIHNHSDQPLILSIEPIGECYDLPVGGSLELRGEFDLYETGEIDLVIAREGCISIAAPEETEIFRDGKKVGPPGDII